MKTKILIVLLFVSVYMASGQPKPYGSGNFGQWITDEYGLPAYDYKQSSSGEDFLHLLGNRVCNVVAHGDGYAGLYSSRYYFSLFNNYSEGNYAGGFGWVNDGGLKWSTHYDDRPGGSDYRLIFGMGYMKKTVTVNNLMVDQYIFVPQGDDEVIMEKLVFTNKSENEKKIDYTDYWDVAMTSMKFNNKFPGWGEFTDYTDNVRTYYDSSRNTIKAVMEGEQGDFTKPSSTDPSKHSIFVSVMNEKIISFDTRQSIFFGSGTRALPDRLAYGTLSNSLDITGMLPQKDALLASQVRLVLKPGEGKTVYILYGVALKGEENKVIDSFRNNYLRRLSVVIGESRNVKLTLPSEYDWVAREMTWNNYYLMAGMLREEYFKTSNINQGGAYFYYWGDNICPRDVLQHLTPLSYTRPEFAKESLRYVFRMMKNNGKLAAGTKQYGILNEGSLDQSDQQFYLFWALYDYLCTTRDWAFLDEVNVYYDGGSASVYEMIKQAYSFVIKVTGKGGHDVFRVKNADWDDGFLDASGNRSATILRGESTANQALACFTLPLLKEIALKRLDSSFEKNLQSEISRVRAVMNTACWKGTFYNRGWVIDKTDNLVEVGSDYPFLESNSFALMADSLMSNEMVSSLLKQLEKDNAYEKCGMRLVNPATKYKSGTSNNIWISPLHSTIQGIINHARDNGLAGTFAWKEFLKATMATRTELWPDIFYGITSGSDCYSPSDGSRGNHHGVKQLMMHFHSQELLSSIRFAGIWSDIDGYLIQPAFPFDTFTWESDRIKVSYSHERISGFIKSSATDVVKMKVKVPDSFTSPSVIADGRHAKTTLENGYVLFSMKVNPEIETIWEITNGNSVSVNPSKDKSVSTGLISPFPANPHYFMYKGKPVVLLNSDQIYGAVINRDFDYVSYLNYLKSKGANFVRIYPGTFIFGPANDLDKPKGPGSEIDYSLLGPAQGRQIVPWKKTNITGAHPNLGGFKFDLDTWDEDYFKRLTDFVKLADRNSVIVDICFFNGMYPDIWPWQPLYYTNNIQGEGNCPYNQHQTILCPDLLRRQEDYVKELTRRLNEFDNVIYDIADEPDVDWFKDAPDKEQVRLWIDRMLKAYYSVENTLPNKTHLVAETRSTHIPDYTADERVTWLNAEGVQAHERLPEEYGHNKPYVQIESTEFPRNWIPDDSASLVENARINAWDFFLEGGAGFIQLNTLYTVSNPTAAGTVTGPIMDQYKVLHDFMNGTGFATMYRFTDCSGPGGAFFRAIAEPRKQYLFYIHHSKKSGINQGIKHYAATKGSYNDIFTVNDLPAGSYRAEWVNPVNGKITGIEKYIHKGGEFKLKTPVYSLDIALKLMKRP